MTEDLTLSPETSSMLLTGFYGKLPSHGDFLRRRVADDFVSVWDPWLQEGLNASRAVMGDRWEEVYLTSPVWRFACAAGACGRGPVIGVMVPSVDRVGRHFPLAIVAPLPASTSVLSAPAVQRAFYDSAEQLMLETLETEFINLARFDQSVLELGGQFVDPDPPRVTLEPNASEMLSDNPGWTWQVPIGSSAELSVALEQVLSSRLSALYAPLVIWWTEGSGMVEPCCTISKGLPRSETFCALLDGSWTASGWRPVASTREVATAPVPPENEDVTEDLPLRFQSVAESNVGRKRKVNQDSFLERTDVGLWAVADGIGGLSEGEVASRMVCDALADFIPDASFEEAIESARGRISEVNAHLSRNATRTVNPVQSGSTVVTLMTRGNQGAILWAGDSRVYRWRGGQLQQVTRDHSQEPAEGETSTAITKAVGGEPTLTLDLIQDRVRDGDRFLLCSDGLTRCVPDPRIGEILGAPEIADAVAGLIQAALDFGAPDNVTAVIVEARQ